MEEPIKAEIILYQSEGANVPVQVRYMEETLWMPQKEIAELFGTTQQNVSLHLKNIFETGELSEKATYKKILLVRNEGNRSVKREVGFYSLDAIVAVGYRVSSMRATRFRQWATATLKAVRQGLLRRAARPHTRHPRERTPRMAEDHGHIPGVQL